MIAGEQSLSGEEMLGSQRIKWIVLEDGKGDMGAILIAIYSKRFVITVGEVKSLCSEKEMEHFHSLYMTSSMCNTLCVALKMFMLLGHDGIGHLLV